MAGHERFALATATHFYMCDPRSPWQRGSNANTNGLLGQCLPKGMTSRATHSQARRIGTTIERKAEKAPRLLDAG
jgi:IS30 family transposase